MKFWVLVSVLGLMSSYAFADVCPSGDQLIEILPDGRKVILTPPQEYKFKYWVPSFVQDIKLHSTTMFADDTSKFNDNIIQNLVFFHCLYITWDANGESRRDTYLYADYVKGKSYRLSGNWSRDRLTESISCMGSNCHFQQISDSTIN